MTTIHSPLPWVGGKHFSAKYILQSFPLPQNYDTYVEPFGGAGHVLVQKPPYKHVEVFNDLNNDLMNCWMHMRDHPDEMKERLETLPTEDLATDNLGDDKA